MELERWLMCEMRQNVVAQIDFTRNKQTLLMQKIFNLVHSVT